MMVEHTWYRGAQRGGAMVLLCLLAAAVPVSIASAGSTIARGYQVSGSGVVSGALLSLRSGTASTAELATPQNRDRLLGVAAKQSLIELSNGNPVQVVTNGVTATLASDINGPIKKGDHLTASPIAGVGMKATQSSMAVGLVQDDMDIRDAATRSIQTLDGKHQTVHIGAVSLLVTPAFFEASSSQSPVVPSALQDLASDVAGRNVAPIRVLVAGLLVLLLFVVVGVLLYSSVRSSIISIGRNPLSEPAVHRSLFNVGVTVVGILAFTVIVVYLILTI